MPAVDYTLPDFNYASAKALITFFLFILGLVLILFLYSVYFKRQERAWNELLRYAYSHKLTTGEIKILQLFFKELGFTFGQNLQLLQQPEFFKEKLQDFYERKKLGDAQQYVQILDKMFPTQKQSQEIYGVNDIAVGEYCSIHFSDGVHLGYVLKKSADELLLRVSNWKPDSSSVGEEIILYFHRLDLGGFLLSGTIAKASSGKLIFRHDGTVEMKGDEHLMAEIKRPAMLKPMDIDFSGNTKETLILDEEGNPINTKENTFHCGCEILSDQGVLLHIRDLVDSSVLKKYDTWSLQLMLDADTEIELEGRIFPSQVYGGRYIFKFLNLSGEDKKLILQEILKYKPTRSRLS